MPTPAPEFQSVPAESQQDFWDSTVSEYSKRQSLWTMALARAYDLPGPPPGNGIVRITNHYNGPSAPSGVPGAVGQAAGGILSSPLFKGVLMGLGGPALLAAGSLLPALLSPKPSLPPLPPQPPVQRVDLGTIGQDGKIVPPQP
ncbi:MAG: hypothetical protein ACYCQK_01330 [Acidiferrobacteraceae bacterium]